MKRSKLKDVEQFLNAFVDEAVRCNVPLICGAMEDLAGKHCLMGEVLARYLPTSEWADTLDTLGLLLGIHRNRVTDIIEGWDRPSHRGTKLPYERLGGRLRVRYLGLFGVGRKVNA